MTAAARRVGWLAVAALLAASLAPLAPWLWSRWRAADGIFSHGPLVPVAVAWLVFRRREALAAAARAPAWAGLALLVPALVLFVAAAALRFDSPALGATWLALPALVLMLEGAARLRVLAFPIAFLLFALPWPMELVAGTIQSLQLLVVRASAALCGLFGAGVTASGAFLVLPSGERLLVDDECSGLKSALALLALGTFMAGTARGIAPWQRALFVGISLPLAIAANVARVTLLTAIALGGGAERARALHDASTWGVYAVVIALYVLLERWMRREPSADVAVAAAPAPPAGAMPSPARASGDAARFLVALALLAASAFAAWRLDRPAPPSGSARLAGVPASVEEWRGRDLAVSERQHALLETTDVLLREYRQDGGSGPGVLACVAVAGPSHKAAHPPEICYRGQGWTIEAQGASEATLAGKTRPLLELVIERRGERHLVWSWYRVGTDETASWWHEQWLAVAARLAGDEDAPVALLRFSTSLSGPLSDDGRDEAAAAARARLARFLESFLPVADAALAAAAAGREAAPPRR